MKISLAVMIQMILLLVCQQSHAGITIDPGIKAVIEVQNEEEKVLGFEESKSANIVIRDLQRKKRFRTSSETGKEVIFQQGNASINVSPFDESYLPIRETLATQAILDAKTQIIRTRMSTMSASELVKFAKGNIKRELESLISKEDKALKKIEKELALLREEAALVSDGLSEAIESDLEGVTVKDLGKALLAAIVKKLDDAFDQQAIADEKRQRLENLKATLASIDESITVREESAEELKRRMAQLQGEEGTGIETSIAVQSQMPLFGATVIFQAESYDKDSRLLRISVLVAWSPKLEDEARGIMLRNAQPEPKEVKKEFFDWLEDQDLRVMVGPRRYINADGSAYYMGISATSYDPDLGGSMEEAELSSRLSAQRMAVLSVMSEVALAESKRQKSLDQSLMVDGKLANERKVFEELASTMMQSIQETRIAGLSTEYFYESHPITGDDMVVTVAFVDSKQAAKAEEFIKRSKAIMSEIAADQNMLAGRLAGYDDEVESARNDRTAYENARRQGRSAIREERRASGEEGSQSNRTEARQQSRQAAEVKSGAWIGDTDVDDPF